MGDSIQTLGASISNLLGDALAAIGNTLSSLLATIGRIVPGGIPVFVVLCAIAILVGLATFRR
jgi:hypothetical protein